MSIRVSSENIVFFLKKAFRTKELLLHIVGPSILEFSAGDTTNLDGWINSWINSWRTHLHYHPY